MPVVCRLADPHVPPLAAVSPRLLPPHGKAHFRPRPPMLVHCACKVNPQTSHRSSDLPLPDSQALQLAAVRQTAQHCSHWLALLPPYRGPQHTDAFHLEANHHAIVKKEGLSGRREVSMQCSLKDLLSTAKYFSCHYSSIFYYTICFVPLSRRK